ncbi:MAG: hypothetical protein ACXWWA_11840, partial [Chitinophagaceae bacterium]
MRRLLLLFILPGFSFIASSQQSKGLTITEKPAKKQVDILFNDKLLTAYCYYDSSRKPFLFP